MKPLRSAVLMITTGLCPPASAVAAFACGQRDPGGAMAAAHAVTAKYHSLNLAKKSGYSILADAAGVTCIAEPQMGAMGVHYVQGDLVKDPSIDAAHPEALVYAPDSHGGLQLAALEYVVIKSDWDAKQPQPPSLGVEARETPAPPMLFGQEFDFTDAPNRYGLPPFYSLHAWIWKENPTGAFRDVEPQRAL
jgi:hypothetical protein